MILALIPMAFVSGMMGPFMGPIPFNAPIAMLASLFIAYTVVPYVAYRWLRRRALRIMEDARAPTLEERGEEHHDWLRRTYLKLFTPLMRSTGRRRSVFRRSWGCCWSAPCCSRPGSSSARPGSTARSLRSAWA